MDLGDNFNIIIELTLIRRGEPLLKREGLKKLRQSPLLFVREGERG